MRARCRSIGDVYSRIALFFAQFLCVLLEERADFRLQVLRSLRALPGRINEPEMVEHMLLYNFFFRVGFQHLLKLLDHAQPQIDDLSVIAELQTIDFAKDR